MSNDTVNRSGKQLEEELTELLGAPWEERRRQYDVRIDQIAREMLVEGWKPREAVQFRGIAQGEPSS